MKFVIANIGRGLSARQVRSDLRKIKRRSRRAVIGFQEIDEADAPNEHAIIKRVFKGRWKKCRMGTKTPVLVKKRFEVIKTRKILATKGIPNVHPNRYIVEVMVQPRNLNVKPVVFMNMHYPPGAWNDKQYRNKAQRIANWNEMYHKHQERVERWVSRGYTVIWGGDVNNMNMPKVHPQERQVVDAGIDNIGIIEADTEVIVKRQGRYGLNSDHDARFIAIRFK